MTKKQSEKNKAWEKDRRDRLNRAFDELAKLLPKYDPSVVWSKIEIIQKSIAYITEGNRKLDDYLKGKHPERFREYEEFVDCIRFYQDRNRQLTELLKESKINLPPVVLPKLLVEKPELLPPPSNGDNNSLAKPKRQRNQSQKRNPKGKATDGKTESESVTDTEKELPESADGKPDKACENPSKVEESEAVTKPTAIITAITRETTGSKVTQPPPPAEPKPESSPPVPVKPFLLRLWKRKSKEKYRKTLFRKCYPHPNRVLEIAAIQKPLPKPFRLIKRKKARRKTAAKRIKLSEIPLSIREQSISPTVAFLHSFPVVTSSLLSGKNVESVEASVSLENLNNFFTTEEYSKFCDQNPVAEDKVPTPVCTTIPVQTVDKSPSSGKPMTSFTVSAITRPCSPKKTIDNINCHAAPSKKDMQDSAMIIENKVINTVAVPLANCFNEKSNSVNSFPRFIQLPTSTKNTVETSNAIPHTPQKSLPSGKPALSAKITTTTSPSVTYNPTSSKTTTSKPIVSSYYSPTKSFFYDFSPQTQPTAFNFPTTPDFISPSTTPSKSHSLLNVLPIKSELPWLPSSTTTISTQASTTNTTSTPSCNLNTSFTAFDSIISDSLTTMNFTYSLTPPKASDPVLAESSKKPNVTTKCNNQMNLFLPYEDVQYTPNFSSLPKITDSPWKAEKGKDATDQIFYDCEQSKQKSHVNWMTSPTADFTPAPAAVPPPSIEFGNNQLQSTSTNFDFTFGCRKDSYDDDNQFINWSPTKPLNTDFTTSYSYENFGSNEAPPNKTIKQIFSVSQLVDNTMAKKIVPKTAVQKSNPVKQTFSNIYSAESLIAKKNHNHRFYNNDTTNAQPDFHNTSSYFYNYSNTQTCTQSENDYLGAASSTNKTTSVPPFDSTTTAPSTNYFTHSISSNAHDPYDPTYFPSTNYNHPTNWSHGHTAMKSAQVNTYNQGYGGVDVTACQQSSNVTGNLTNFNLSSICPEIHGKTGPQSSTGW